MLTRINVTAEWELLTSAGRSLAEAIRKGGSCAAALFCGCSVEMLWISIFMSYKPRLSHLRLLSDLKQVFI